MSSYQTFAYLYDELTQNVEYEKRCNYICSFLNKNNLSSGTVLDLACGTGSFSVLLMNRGFDIVGIDCSEEMLEIASNRLSEAGNNFSLMKAKMQNFSLSAKVDAAICCLDSINHLNSLDDVEQTFKNVFSSLNKNGMFIFDVNTIYKHNEVLADNTFVFDEDDYYLVWDNEKEDDRTVRLILDMFIYNGSSYDRYGEEFEETAYSVTELKNALDKAGFSDIKIYDELTFDKPNDKSERIYFVCKKVK